MPAAAVEAGLADLILPLDEVCAALAGLPVGSVSRPVGSVSRKELNR
jgi:hypothetical protein